MDKEAEQQQISTLYCTLYPYMYIRILRVTAGLSILISGLHTYFLFLFVNIVVRDLPTKCGPYLVQKGTNGDESDCARASEDNRHKHTIIATLSVKKGSKFTDPDAQFPRGGALACARGNNHMQSCLLTQELKIWSVSINTII